MSQEDTEVKVQQPETQRNGDGELREREFNLSNQEPEAGNLLSSFRERSLFGLTNQTRPLRAEEITQLRRLILAERESRHKTWWQRNAFSVLLILLISVTVGIGWKRINALENASLSTTVEICFDLALTLIENNSELLGDEKISTLISIAERETYLNYQKKTPINERLGHLISKSTSATSTDILAMADTAIGRHDLRAITLYKISHEMYRKEGNSADDEARRIGLTIAQISGALNHLADVVGMSRDGTICDREVKYMENLLSELRKLPNVNSAVKAINEGRCSVDLVRIISLIGQHKKAITLADEGIEVLQSEFGDKVSRYQYYGFLLNNQGYAYESMKEYANAERCYAKAVEAKLKAVDYQTEDAKLADIRMTRGSLERVQAFPRSKVIDTFSSIVRKFIDV